MAHPQEKLTGAMRPIYDKHGREIMLGDVLKIYHFTAALRRKKHYMYKQVTEIAHLGESRADYFFVSHLMLKARGEKDDGFYLPLDGKHYPDYEIVQGLDAWWDQRPRVVGPTLERLGDQS